MAQPPAPIVSNYNSAGGMLNNNKFDAKALEEQRKASAVAGAQQKRPASNHNPSR